MSKIVLLLLKATWRWLALAALIGAMVVFLDLGRDALTRARARSAAVEALDAEEARARAADAKADAELQERRGARDVLHARLLTESRSALGEADRHLKKQMTDARALGEQAEERLTQTRRELTEASRSVLAQAERQQEAACREGVAAYVACQWAEYRYEKARFELDRRRAEVEAQLAPLKDRAVDASRQLRELSSGAEAFQARWAEPLGVSDRAELDAVDTGIGELEDRQRIAREQATAAAQEREDLLAGQGPADRALAIWEERGAEILGLALFLLLLPYIRRTVWYWGLMPLAERRPPLRLAAGSGRAEAHAPEPEVSLEVVAGQTMRVRSSYVGRREGRPDTEWVFGGWAHPFTSLVAGLSAMDRFRPDEDPWTISVGNPQDPDSQLLRLDLHEHPGFVVHPAHLVALLGDLRLRRRWRLFHLHSWMTFQFRYLLAEGTGSIVLEGRGHLQAEPAGGAVGIASARVLAFDGQLAYRTTRTRPFWPYLAGLRGLVEDMFEGDAIFVVGKTVQDEARMGPAQKVANALFSAVEKALGIA